MLALTRTVNQGVCIGDDIKVHVVSIQGDNVRLAFEAPRHVAIDRIEVRQSKLNDGVRTGGN